MLFPILVAASLTEEVNLFRLAVMLVEIALLATLVYGEQCAIGRAGERPAHPARSPSARFSRNQRLCRRRLCLAAAFQLWRRAHPADSGVAVAFVDVQSLSLSLFLLMFLLLREAGLSLLWRLALVDANESIDALDALTTPTLQTLRRI